MRDGIFKTASLSKKWHTVGNRAEREADEGVRLVDAVDDALRQDIQKEIAKGLKGVVGLVIGGQLSILKGNELKDFVKKIQPDSRFAQDVIRGIRFICRGGTPLDSQALIDAVSHASKKHVQAVQADMLGHARQNTDEENFKAVADRLDAAASQVDYSGAARDVLLGKKVEAGKKDHSFTLGENLLG